MERASSRPLERLGRVRLLLPLLVVLAVPAALLAPAPLSGLAAVLAGAFLGWLAYLAWPRLTTGERALRVAVLVVFGLLLVLR